VGGAAPPDAHQADVQRAGHAHDRGERPPAPRAAAARHDAAAVSGSSPSQPRAQGVSSAGGFASAGQHAPDDARHQSNSKGGKEDAERQRGRGAGAEVDDRRGAKKARTQSPREPSPGVVREAAEGLRGRGEGHAQTATRDIPKLLAVGDVDPAAPAHGSSEIDAVIANASTVKELAGGLLAPGAGGEGMADEARGPLWGKDVTVEQVLGALRRLAALRFDCSLVPARAAGQGGQQALGARGLEEEEEEENELRRSLVKRLAGKCGQIPDAPAAVAAVNLLGCFECFHTDNQVCSPSLLPARPPHLLLSSSPSTNAGAGHDHSRRRERMSGRRSRALQRCSRASASP